MRSVLAFVFIMAAAGLVAGCGSEKAEDPPPATGEQTTTSDTPKADPAAAKAEARTVFDTRCVACHGAGGKGDGPASAGLDPKPRDLSDAEWQSSVTDEHIEKIIMYGGGAVGKSPAMPANPDLSSKEEVVKALREIVRNLGN